MSKSQNEINSIYSRAEFTSLGGYHKCFRVRGSLHDSIPEAAPVETVTIPNVGDVSVIIPIGSPLIVRWVLNPDLDEFISTNASFWIEIGMIDSTEVAWIKARMWTGHSWDRTGRTYNIFPPNNRKIIPIGIVTPREGVCFFFPTDAAEHATDAVAIENFYSDNAYKR